MGIIFDTSEIISLERSAENIDTLVRGREDEPFGISAVTIAELLHGVERADTEIRKTKRLAFVEKVIELFPAFPFDTAVARIYARLWATLAKKGKHVGAHDLIIAAKALSMDYTIVTAKARDFDKIEGIRIEKRS